MHARVGVVRFIPLYISCTVKAKVKINLVIYNYFDSICEIRMDGYSCSVSIYRYLLVILDEMGASVHMIADECLSECHFILK